MKNIISAVRYFFKNFFVMALFSLPVAAAFALKYNSSFYFDFLLKLNSLGSTTLMNIYSHFSLLPDFNILTILLWTAVSACCFCLMFSYSERHMKYGIKSFLKAVKSINYSIMAVLPAFITIFAIEEIFSFFIALFINLFSLSQSDIINFVLPSIFVLMSALLFMAYSVISLWVPIKMVTGYSHKDSIRYSIRLTQGKQIGIMLGLAFPLVLTLPVMVLLKEFSNIEVLNTAVYTLCYVFIVGYIPSYCMSLYFDFSGAERKDIKKKIIRGNF